MIRAELAVAAIALVATAKLKRKSLRLILRFGTTMGQ